MMCHVGSPVAFIEIHVGFATDECYIFLYMQVRKKKELTYTYMTS